MARWLESVKPLEKGILERWLTMDPRVIEEIKKLCKQEGSEEEIEKLLEQYLRVHPKDVKAWIRLAIVVFEPPIADYDKSIACLKRAIEIDPECLEAVLIVAYMQHLIYGEVDEDVFQRINSVQADDDEERAMIEYAKAWYYETKEMWDKYVYHLEKSIEAYSGHVYNYEDLGQYYINNGKKEKGKSLLMKAISNVKYIFRDDDSFDYTDYNKFVNERIKGIYMTDVLFDSLKERIESL